MTLPSTPRRAGPFNGNDSATSFAFTFKVFADEDILVVRTSSAGVETALTLDSDYSVTLNGDQESNPGGTVTYPISGSPLATGQKLTIAGALEYDQPTDIPDGGNFSPTALENALDRIEMQIQQLAEESDRTVMLPVSVTGVSATLPTPSAYDILGWNADATALENVTVPLSSDTVSAANVNHLPAGASSTVTAQSEFRERVNANAYGADPTGATDSTAAVTLAFATGRPVYFGPGTYKMNIVLTDNMIMIGSGSNETFWEPWNTAVACVTYRKGAPFWTYHSQVRDGCFRGTSKVGIGFTFGRTNPADFVAGDQYANNVQFENVDFRGLDKGCQFPFGNIGTTFRNCGAHDNRYGFYLLDNKFGGDIMHAGNKYWIGGEWSGNDCALYLSNTTVGFGGIGLKDVIIEYNLIGMYTAISGEQFVPIAFENVWFEGNGQTTGTSAATVSIDLWTGTTRSTQTPVKRTFIFDGALGRVNITGGNFTDANVAATDAFIYCFNSAVEKTSGYLGGPVDVNSGQVVFDTCFSDGGFPTGFGIVCKGRTRTTSAAVDLVASNGARRGFLTTARRSRIPALLDAGLAEPFTASRTLLGNFSVVGSVVADGQVFGTCNEFVKVGWPTAEYSGLSGSSYTTTAAGWFAMTVEVRVLVGAPKFYFWDRGSTTLLATEIPTPRIGNWFTLAAIAYVGAAGKTFFFDVGNPATTQDVTFRLSALQIHRFDSQALAMDFIDAEAYSYDGAIAGWAPDTGTDKRTANATYSGTASAGYVQAEAQAVMNALRDATQTIKALKADLVTQGLLKA